MATPGQVQIYSPARALPPGFTGRPAPPPVRPSPQQVQASRRATPSLAGRWSALEPYVQQATAKKTQETAEQAMKKAEEKARNDAYNKMPWYKKALVNTLDNPVTQLVTTPLSVLSVPGKAIALGKQELSAHLPRGVAEWAEHPFGKGEYVDALNEIASLVPLSPFGVDTDKARANKRGVLERIAPRSDFGHGSIQASTGSQWGDRLMGFGGDMLNDPLMLLEGGGVVSRPAILAGDAAHVAGVTPEVITAAREASEAAARHLAEREALASMTGVDEGLVGARKAAAEAAEAERLAPSTVIREQREIPIPHNRKARATLATEWATENPTLWQKHAAEITKGVKQGFEAMSPEARADLGVKTGNWALKGIGEIPFTEPIRQVMKDVKGVRRAAFSDLLDKIPGALDETSSAYKLRNARALKGAEGAFQVLRNADSTTEQKELALNEIFLRNQLPIGEGPMKARGATFVKQALREAKQAGPEATRQAITEAETQPGMNWVNKIFSNIQQVHERLTGKELMSSIDRESYVPGVLDSNWRRNLAKTKDPAAQAFMHQSGIVKDDLLEASHFLDKKRVFSVPPGKTEQEFDFAGKKVVLKGNTIDDKNAALRQAFPDWKGDFYSKDLNVIAETYLDSLARDAGARHARAQLAGTASPYAKVLDGMLWDEYETMNRALKQQPYARRVTDVTSQGYNRGVGLEDVAAAEPVPSSGYFRAEKDKKLTEQLRQDVQGAGHQWQTAARQDIQTVQAESRDVLEDLRKNWAEGLRLSAKEDNPRIKELGKIVEAVKDKVRGFGVGKITSDNANEVSRSLAKIDNVIADLEKEMSSRKRVWNGKITRANKRVDANLAEKLRILKGERERLEAHVEDVGVRLKAEIEERRAWINGDVPEKEAALAAKEATIPKPSPSQPDVIDRAYETTGLKSHPEYERMQQRYTEAIRALQSSREDGRLFTKSGAIRKSDQKLIDEVEMARDALRRVGWDPAKDYEGGLVRSGTDAQGRNKYTTSTGWKVEHTTPETKAVPTGRTTGPRYTQEAKPIPGKTTPSKPLNYQVKDPEDLYTIAQNAEGEWTVTPKKGRKKPSRPFRTHSEAEEHAKGLMADELSARLNKPTGRRLGRFEKRVTPRWKVIDPEGNVVETYDSFVAASDHAMTEHVKAVDPPQYFHGTTNRVGKFQDAGGNDPIEQLLGAGVYTTGDEEVGVRYSREKGRADTFTPTNEVYRMEGPQGPKLDLDKKIDYGLREHLLDIYRRQIEPLNVNDELNDHLSPFVRSVEHGLGGETTGEEAITSFMGMLRSLVSDQAIDRDHANEMLMELNQKLRDDGYVAMTHTGGVRMGDKLHPVTIWLDPNSVEIKDVLHQKGTWREAKEELAKQQAIIDNYDGPTQPPDKFVDNPNVPQWMNVNGVQRPNLTPSTINPEYTKYLEWQTARARVRVLEERFGPRGNLHPYEQAANWEKEQARYRVDLEDATKEERAALDAAKAARDTRAGQRESIVRSGPDVGSQVWPSQLQAPVDRARQALEAKEASFTPPHSPRKAAEARRLEEEEARLIKWHEQGNMSTAAYQAEKRRLTELRSDAIEELTANNKAGMYTKAEYRAKRAQIDVISTNDFQDLEERFSGRLNDEEFTRRMRVIQDRREKLQLGPRIADPEATKAALEAARERVALSDVAPNRVIGPDDIGEGVTKPVVEGGKLIKYTAGDYAVEMPPAPGTADVRRWTITKDPTTKQWKLKRPGDTDPVREFRTLREAGEYARDDAARSLATTSAERRLLPPAEPGNYIGMASGLQRQEMSAAEQAAAKRAAQPGAKEIISADDWFKANVRAATRPEREAFDRSRAIVEEAKPVSPRWMEPLGGFGPEEERFVERINTPPQPAAFETKAVSAETGQLAGVPSPRTEAEAVQYLSSQISPVSGTITPGSDLHDKVVRPFEEARAAEQKLEAEAPFRGEKVKARIDKWWGAKRDAEVGALSEKHHVFENLKTDLTERESLLRKRSEVIKLRERLMAVPRRPNNDDLIDATEELLAIAKANPNLDNNALNAAESLLHTHLAALQALEGPKQLMNQVQFLSGQAANKNLDDVSRAVLSDSWDAIHKGLLEKGDVIIDSRLAAAMQNMYNMQKAPGIVGRGFKMFTNLFKTYATLSPGFMTRNAMGGIFMNTADGVPVEMQAKAVGLWRKWERGGEEWLAKQPRPIQEAFSATFASGAGGRVAEAGVAGKSQYRVYNKLMNNPLTRGAQRGGEKIEGALRLAMAMHSVERGETVAGAVDRIGRVHFNYAEVSQLDESAKQMIPFWTFMSRNLPLQYQEMFTNPRLYSLYGHAQRNFSQPDAENTPAYWKGLGTWRLPFDFLGQPAYYQPDFGFNRVQSDITNVADTLSGKNPLAIMSSVNPGFSAPLDFAYGKDSFTGRQFGPDDFSKVSGPWGAIEKAIATVVPGQTNEAGQVSDNWLNLMRSINPIDDRVNRLAPGAVGGISDPKRLAESWARFTGIPYRTLSPKQQENEAMRRYFALQDEYKRQGAMTREQAS